MLIDAWKDDYEEHFGLVRPLLRPGSVVVADNVRFPGAPRYRRYMEAEEGKRWRTVRHEAHAEYQGWVRDVVFESTLV